MQVDEAEERSYANAEHEADLLSQRDDADTQWQTHVFVESIRQLARHARSTARAAVACTRPDRRQQQTGLCSASYVGCQRDTARICCWAPCCGCRAVRRAPWLCCARLQLSAGACYRSISPILLSARRSATNPPAAAVNRWDRRTDRQIDGRSTVS